MTKRAGPTPSDAILKRGAPPSRRAGDRQRIRKNRQSRPKPSTVTPSTVTPSTAKPSTAKPSAVRPGAMLQIGSRIHHARLLREARMKDVAQAADCSESLISKIENNKVVPSLRVLHRICEALNLTLGDLLATSDEGNKVITKAHERHIVDIDSLRAGKGIRMERLVPYAKGHLLQGNIHVIAPGGSTDGDISHSGEEVGYVISGHIELTIDGKVYDVAPGDSFCFRSELPHGYRNVGTTEARVLFVNTPPTF
jgi:quercetin dioxygenase-like cupin family protein/DNA-binding Xre family transcriptional regulator